MKFHPVAITRIISDVVNFITAQANMNSVTISTDLNDCTALIWGEENQLKQVFINLAKNAIEAMPTGGHLNITVLQTEQYVTIRFIDQGNGIPEQMLAEIGNPFFTTK